MINKHVVMFSGGAGSWFTARRVAERYGTDNLILLFGDTKMEDDDLYRFLHEAAVDVGGELVIVADGRNVWEVFRDKRYLGNTRIDPCSRVLKRELLRRWLETNCDPASTVVYLGIDWTESHRFEKALKYWSPWTCKAPLCDPPYLFKADIFRAMTDAGIAVPRLYAMGFPHNNCGGFCVKAGVGAFKLLLEKMPERYRYHEEQEEAFRRYINKDVSILRDRRGGVVTPLTLRTLRERIEDDGSAVDSTDLGGCACFTPNDYDEDHDQSSGPLT